MEYHIQSKPTIYNGTKFRSRLEARWAAFFDLMGWRWQYEPCDLKGWTPDFVVYGSKERLLFIEVKPVVDKVIANEYAIKISSIKPTINAIMICPSFKEDGFGGSILAGYQISHHDPDYYYNGKFNPFEVHWKMHQSGINSQYDIGSDYMAFDGMLWRCENRKRFLTCSSDEYEEFSDLWIEAGELTRFHYGKKI